MNGLFTLSQDAIPALLQVIMIDPGAGGRQRGRYRLGGGRAFTRAARPRDHGRHEVWPHLFG